MARLVFYRANERLFAYRLSGVRTVIGRDDTSDVVLPGDTVSRTHCLVEQRDGRWWVIDRSRHGTLLEGTKVDGRAELSDGSHLAIGPYIAELRLARTTPEPTADLVADRTHEVIVATGEHAGLVVEQAVLVVVEGPDAGQRQRLDRRRVSVGGEGSGIVLGDPTLLRDHCWLRIARSRVMVEPGAGPAWLDGERVREITPLYADEDFRIGHTRLRVEIGTRDEVPLARRFGEMRGESRAMQEVFGTLRRMAGHHFPVLIMGESGTGKELAARGIHAHSERAQGPFVAVNCGAITPSLFESELFGHVKGAFTGADRAHEGAFQAAAGGTLFLDEVGELPEEAQAKLLRALETGEVRRVGSMEIEYPDVRIIAATNRDLAAEVRAGRFREDLFFRLAVLGVTLPPLRKHKSDLPILCRALCAQLHPTAHVTPDALDLLSRHSWPGNVRELRNVLTRAYVLGGPRIGPEYIQFHVLDRESPGSTTTRATLEQAERDYILSVLERHDHNRSAAARELGIPRSSLHYKMRKLGIT